MHLPPAVIVHGLPHAQAALAPGLPVTLLSAPGAAIFAGAGWWRALMDEAGNPPNILDCGVAPGRALEALRCGLPALIMHAPPAIFTDIAERAARQGAIVLAAAPAALDLGQRGAHRRLEAWLKSKEVGGDEAVPPKPPGFI
jgi:hypothetical protein